MIFACPETNRSLSFLIALEFLLGFLGRWLDKQQAENIFLLSVQASLDFSSITAN